MQTAKVTALNGKVNGLHHKGSARANAVAGRRSGKQAAPRTRTNERAPARNVKVSGLQHQRNDVRISRTQTWEKLLLPEAFRTTGMTSTGMTGRTSTTITRITIIAGITPLPHL
jgi:hypothetical protein